MQFLRRSQIIITPVQGTIRSDQKNWVAVTDGRYTDDKPQFSPDGNTVYFTSTRDGYICICAQRLDPRSKRPLGPPVPFEHFHNMAGGEGWNMGQIDAALTVARNKIMINLLNFRRELWLMQIE